MYQQEEDAIGTVKFSFHLNPLYTGVPAKSLPMADEKDLQLLDQALSKFGIASEEQFPTLTATLLPPLLEKLSSPNATIRSKVRDLSHSPSNYLNST